MNELGLTVNHTFILTLVWLAVIVIVSACFNYTNLSIARALRRAREVGIRKVTGATRGQVFGQFLFESTLVALIAVTMAFVIFLLVRPEFLSMNQAFQQLATLTPTPTMLLSFVMLALVIGIVAGVLPAAFFSKMSTAQVLKDVSSIKLFRHLPLRKALIVLQYALSILFIVVVSLGYRQYRYWLSLDMGFNTENVLTVDLLGNNPAPLLNAFAQLPEVKQLSASSYVSSAGMSYEGMVKYNDLQDSVPLHYNFVNEGYLSLYGHTLLAGTNFTSSLPDQSNLIINEHALHWMKLTDPREAIGETITLDGKKFRVIGVVKDFQHNRPNQVIQNFAFRNDPSRYGVISLKLQTSDIRTTMARLNDAWRTIDRIHPLPATFHDERIRAAFEDLSWMIRMIGAIALLSIGIAMLGLLGMVIFATETRVKEISIRKVMGASERYLVLLMSRGFLLLLLIASALAIPAGYFFCDQVVFSRSVHHAPLSALDLFGGTALVILIAMLMIGSQTWKVARSNPARVLKNE
jgi:ABC-type antimicrobial peptide transport system permease subunit